MGLDADAARVSLGADLPTFERISAYAPREAQVKTMALPTPAPRIRVATLNPSMSGSPMSRRTTSGSSLTASVITKLDLDGAAGGRRALFVSGTIGPAAANWFRGKLDEAHLTKGDMIVLSSPGGDLNQAAIIGEKLPQWPVSPGPRIRSAATPAWRRA